MVQTLVKGVAILDSDGARIGVKYFDPNLLALDAQLALEKSLFMKTNKTVNARKDTEVVMFDQYIAVFRFCSDASIFVVASLEENEMILSHVLMCIEESLVSLLRAPIDRPLLIDNLDLLLLTIDEVIDDGIVLETDSQVVVDGVTMKGADKDAPIAEQSLAQAFMTAKETFAKTFR